MTFDPATITPTLQPKPPAIALLGEAGVGKSTFGASCPSPIFAPIKGEDGIHQIKGAMQAPVSNTLGEFGEFMVYLQNEKHDYKTLVVDSANPLELLIQDSVCREYNVGSLEDVGAFGKGVIEVGKTWRKVLAQFDVLRKERGMMIVLIGHVVIKKVRKPDMEDDYDEYVFNINEKHSAARIIEWCDLLGFAKEKILLKNAADDKKATRAVGSGERVLCTDARPGHPGKTRYKLPYEVDLSWEALAAAMKEGQA